MTAQRTLEPTARGLHAYVCALALLSLAVLAPLAVVGAAQPWSPVVLPVTLLVCAAHLCPVWTSTRRLRSQWLDAADVGLVVAVVLLPLPVALLVASLAGLLTVLVEFRRSPVRVAYNASHVVLTTAAVGGLLAWWEPTGLLLPWAAAAACFLVEQLLAQPMLLTVASLAEGVRPSGRRLVLDRPAPASGVALLTASFAGLIGHAALVGGAAIAWPAAALVCALMLVARSRLGVQQEARRLLHAVRVLTASDEGRGTRPVLATLDAALQDVAGVQGLRLVPASDGLPPDHLSQGVPGPDGSALRLLVRRPLETSTVFGGREDTVRSLLETGAHACARAQTAAALLHDASHDSLTGLLDRGGFGERATAELARARRGRRSAVLLYVDLDRFKAVNDAHGHETGDRALRQVAGALRELVRPHDLVARLGGDEFVLLLVDLATCGQAAGVVQRVEDQVARGWVLDAVPQVRLRGSVGTSRFPDDADALPGLLRAADTRMYARKRAR